MAFKNKLILMGAILFNLFLVLNLHHMFLFLLIKIIIIYVANDYEIAILLIMKLILVYIMIYYYFVENFDCVSNNEIISTSARTLDCQEICKNRKDCKYNFQPIDESNQPRNCYVSKGIGIFQNLNLGKCKEEQMVPWVNTKFKGGAKEILLFDGSDRFSGWRYHKNWDMTAYNAVGGMNRKRFRFKNAYISRIQIKNIYVYDQGWGNRTYLYVGVVSPTKNDKYIYISKNARNTYKFNINQTFDINEEYKKGNVVNEVYVRPSRMGSGHTMKYGGISNIKIWGYEV